MLSLLIPLLLISKVESKNLSESQKYRNLCVEQYVVPSTVDITSGVNGVIIAETINGVSNVNEYSDIANVLFPTRMHIQLMDYGSNDTLTCTSVKMYGIDQFGVRRVETFTNIGETQQTTTYAYSMVEGLEASGCSGASSASDVIRVSMSKHLGLTLKINSTTDVEMACIYDASDTGLLKCARSNDNTANDIQSAVSTETYSIDLSNAMFGQQSSKVAIGPGDVFCYSIRPSFL